MKEAKEALLNLNKAYADGVIQLKTFREGVSKANAELKVAEDTLNKIPSTSQAITTTVASFTGVFNAFQTAFQATADLWYGNITQLVALYNAQISVISAQNTYTQALALQAAAVSIYGSNSEQATRATTAANYVGALYTQSKMNETVAQEQYYTATAQNLSIIATQFVAAANALGLLQTATTGFTLASILSAQELTAASLVPFAGLALVGGLTAYELATQKSPTVGMPAMSGTGGGGGSSGSSMAKSPNVEIHIHASSNVDLPKVRQEVQTAIAQSTLHAQKQRGVY